MIEDEMTHTVTVWPRNSSGYGTPYLIAPGGLNGGARWTTRRKKRASTVSDLNSNPEASLIVPAPVALGDLVALGDHTADNPEDVPSVHTVTEYTETPGLFDELYIRRATLRAVFGQFWKTIRVYPIERNIFGRSSVLERGSLVYEGPGEIQQVIKPAERIEQGGRISVYDTVITLPASVDLRAHYSYEIEWDAPSGTLIFEAVSPLILNSNAPFLQEATATLKTPAHGNVPT